jgi:hypothetical protein
MPSPEAEGGGNEEKEVKSATGTLHRPSGKKFRFILPKPSHSKGKGKMRAPASDEESEPEQENHRTRGPTSKRRRIGPQEPEPPSPERDQLPHQRFNVYYPGALRHGQSIEGTLGYDANLPIPSIEGGPDGEFHSGRLGDLEIDLTGFMDSSFAWAEEEHQTNVSMVGRL